MPVASLSESLHDLLRLWGGNASNDACLVPAAVPVWRVRAGAPLLLEGAPADLVHVVRSGSFKCQRVGEDGYEQVLAFLGPGDVPGIDALDSGRHDCGVVALEDSTVYALPAREFERLRRLHPALDQGLQHAMARQLADTRRTVEMMAAVAAEVRLGRFLLWLSESMAARGQSPRRLLLRMSRRDIASLLGIAHETVSRAFTALADLGLLRVENRDVEILDAQGLRRATRATRSTLIDLPAVHGVPATRRAPALAA